MNETVKVYPYRWVVLATYMFINLTIQLLWISFAPITSMASEFYGVPELRIGFLSMLFMIMFIPLSIPASWLIDSRGYRLAVSIGAGLMGIFGLLRGFAGSSFSIVLWSTVGIAAAQPFLLNSWTTVPAKWFPLKARATMVGLITLANLVGTGIGMVATPILAENDMPISTIQLIYGGITAVSSLLFILLAREEPPSPPDTAGEEVRALVLDGLKHALTVKSFLIYLLVTFIGFGIFNGITTWIEAMIKPRGFSPTDAGTLGALMLVGGLLGSVVLPSLSDKFGKRKIFMQLGILLSIPGLLGMAYLQSPVFLFAAAFFLGFFLISLGPIGMQYSAEVTVPTPEGTSNGLIQLFGQVSVVFVYVMGAMRTPEGSFTPSLLLMAGLLVLGLLLSTQMKDPL